MSKWKLALMPYFALFNIDLNVLTHQTKQNVAATIQLALPHFISNHLTDTLMSTLNALASYGLSEMRKTEIIIMRTMDMKENYVELVVTRKVDTHFAHIHGVLATVALVKGEYWLSTLLLLSKQTGRRRRSTFFHTSNHNCWLKPSSNVQEPQQPQICTL